MDEGSFKEIKTQRGFTYSYYFSPRIPDSGKPVIFFSHGFPSGSYVWREQVAFFKLRGYGVLVPDLLGYGGTDKPTDPELYIGSGLAQDVVDIFDAEGIKRVIAIGHDWGSYLVSRLINHHPNRVSACAFLTVGYAPPAASYMAAINEPEQLKKLTMLEYDVFAYRRFFIQPDAAEIIEKNIDSFICLVYPDTPQLWKEHLCVEGGTRAWIESNKKNILPSYMTTERVEREKLVLLKGGLSGPLCWYKVAVDEAKVVDDAKVPREAYDIMQPLLYVAFTRDPISLPRLIDSVHKEYAKGIVTRKEIDADHWGVDSHPAELSAILIEWIEGLDV
ncbi:alpha/beta-hydrolase [Mycena epipterygia]|nr:alpha/beta-hydrolase [Mycena epipterygia]